METQPAAKIGGRFPVPTSNQPLLQLALKCTSARPDRNPGQAFLAWQYADGWYANRVTARRSGSYRTYYVLPQSCRDANGRSLRDVPRISLPAALQQHFRQTRYVRQLQRVYKAQTRMFSICFSRFGQDMCFSLPREVGSDLRSWEAWTAMARPDNAFIDP